MGRDILKYGVIAGLVVAAGMWGTLLAFGKEMPHGMLGMALGYLTMLVALSAVAMGIKHHRDVDRGGVIGFWPANAVGDDAIQKKMQGQVVPDSFTHGTSEQRMYWFNRGFKSGDINKGDSFSEVE